MYIGRDFKREIELDKLNEDARHLRPNRNWLDLFSLSLSDWFNSFIFDFTTLTDNLSENEVIIIDSHDDIFKGYQIQYWSKDSIFDILPAIKCPSFKPETKFFKTSKTFEIWNFIYNQDYKKSVVIENADEKLSINLVYGNTIKITPRKFYPSSKYKFYKLEERYELWKIRDCECKPKKIRVWGSDFRNLKHTIKELERISNINDAKLGIDIYDKDYDKDYDKSFSNCDTIIFNNSSRLMSYKDTNLIFTGDTFAVVSEGNYYNFRLDQKTKESEDSYIKGKI